MRALHPNPACIQPQHALPLFALVCPGFSLFFFWFFFPLPRPFFLVVQGRLSARPSIPRPSPLPSTRGPLLSGRDALARWKGWTVGKTKIATMFSMGSQNPIPPRWTCCGDRGLLPISQPPTSRWLNAHAPFPSPYGGYTSCALC